MPMAVTVTAASTGYASPMVGPVDHTVHCKLDLSGLTMDEVDVDGYLKPGVIFKESGGLGVLIGGAAGVPLVNPEAVKLAVTTPTTLSTLGAETGDHFVALCTHGIVNRDIAEDNMGRAYAANELTSFITAGSNLSLTTT